MLHYRHQLAAVGLAVATALSSPALSADAPTRTPIDARFNTLGVTIGQTPVQVHAALAKELPNGTFQDAERVDPVSGSKYVSQILFHSVTPDPANPGDRLSFDNVSVLFSAPTTGNLSLAIDRGTTYLGNGRPVAASVIDGLEQKYGKAPSLAYEKNSGFVANEKFMFGRDGQVIAKDPRYQEGNCGVSDPGGLGSFTSACSSATLDWQTQTGIDPQRLESLRVMIKDTDLALAALKLDREAAQQAHDAEIAKLRSNGPSAKL